MPNQSNNQTPILLTAGALSLAQLRTICAGAAITLSDESRDRVKASHQAIMAMAARGDKIYGITTGFGKLANRSIPLDRLGELQRNLVNSHAAGVGPLTDPTTTRLTMALKAASLAQGYSGVAPATIDLLVAMLNADILPEIPLQGSVGASGDLAPLAHLTRAMIGEGMVQYHGRQVSAADALQQAGLQPITLGPKEGLALLNGTQFSTAIAIRALLSAEILYATALVTGAMTTDAVQGSDTPFDARIHRLRRHQGQQDAAASLLRLLEGSAIRQSHLTCDRVQDPYCLRCQPQVMGAVLDQLRHCAARLVDEANAVSDNPLIVPTAEGAADFDVISGGNFHAEPVALAADLLAIACAEIGALSERRTAMLMDSGISGLPAFLVGDSGVNSGFMIAQVTAAALASENKQLASPASVDSIPTSANQEDHVSMAPHAGRKALAICDNLERILAVELLCAAQGIDFRRPLHTSPLLEKAYALIRRQVPFWDQDRYMAADLEQAATLIRDGALHQLIAAHDRGVALS